MDLDPIGSYTVRACVDAASATSTETVILAIQNADVTVPCKADRNPSYENGETEPDSGDQPPRYSVVSPVI